MLTVFLWLNAGTSEHANETSVFVKCREFFSPPEKNFSYFS